MTQPSSPTEIPPSGRYHVKRYGNRQWALYDGDELLAVTVYRKGADSVQRALEARDAVIAEQAATIEQLTAERAFSPAPDGRRFQDRVRSDRARALGSATAEPKERYAARKRGSGQGR